MKGECIMTGKVLAVMNEQHSLLEDQQRVLDENFPEWELFSVPAQGWKLDEIREVVYTHPDDEFVFVSPVPGLMALCASYGIPFTVFHNDKRVAKEITTPDGGKKIIHSVAPTGWELV
jgi:hypothetical protein